MKKTVNSTESKSTLTTINTNKKGAITMKKTTRRTALGTRILAAVLAAVTACSVGTMAVSTASAAVPPAMVGTVLKYMTSKSFGYAKDSVMKLAGRALKDGTSSYFEQGSRTRR